MNQHEQIHDLFKYHEPTPDQSTRMGKVGQAAEKLCHLIVDKVPLSADRTHAIRLIKDATMWLNGAISREVLGNCGKNDTAHPISECNFEKEWRPEVPHTRDGGVTGPAVFGGTDIPPGHSTRAEQVTFAKELIDKSTWPNVDTRELAKKIVDVACGDAVRPCGACGSPDKSVRWFVKDDPVAPLNEPYTRFNSHICNASFHDRNEKRPRLPHARI
jgi:hypothetical protein